MLESIEEIVAQVPLRAGFLILTCEGEGMGTTAKVNSGLSFIASSLPWYF